jgi:hypothetical protein
MSESTVHSRRFVARLRAFLEEDWKGKAGAFFRRGISSISEVNDEYLHLGEKAEEAPDLAWRAVQGLAGEKHAKAVSDYARAENEKIDLALKQRVLDDKVRQEKATADKLEAEAAIAKINELKARAELAKTLSDLNMAITVAPDGGIRVFRDQRLPADFISHIFSLSEKRDLGLVVDVTLRESFGSSNFELKDIKLVKWLCKVGDRVEHDQPILEIETEILDAEVPSPVTGIIYEIKVSDGAIDLDTVIGRIEKNQSD